MGINPFIKCIMQNVYGHDPRPLRNCIDKQVLACHGMPSGHIETTLIVVALLVNDKVISKPVAVCAVLLMAIQRVVSKRHTINQVIVGATIGTIFALLYIILDNPFMIVFVALLCFILLWTTSTLLIDYKVMGPLPKWVDDQELYEIVEKKRGMSIITKMISVASYVMIVNYREMYCSWSQLEKHMDELLVKIRTNGQFDAIIGIKSGGAIIGSYMALQLGIPCYYMKVSSKCEKTFLDSGFAYAEKHVHDQSKIEYILCEGIRENIKGMRILLVDECIDTGNSLAASREYLLKVKQVKDLVTTTVSVLEPKNVDKIQGKFVSLYHPGYGVWPWGYDN